MDPVEVSTHRIMTISKETTLTCVIVELIGREELENNHLATKKLEMEGEWKLHNLKKDM